MGGRCQTSHSEPATMATATPMADMAHTAMAIRMAQDTMAGMATATHTARTMAVMAQHIRGMATATPMAAPMAMATPMVPAATTVVDMDMATHLAGATMATTRFSSCLCVNSYYGV